MRDENKCFLPRKSHRGKRNHIIRKVDQKEMVPWEPFVIDPNSCKHGSYNDNKLVWQSNGRVSTVADYEIWPNPRPINPNLSGKKADENSKASKIEGKYHVVLILKVSVAPTSFSKSVNSQYNKFVIFFFSFNLHLMKQWRKS